MIVTRTAKICPIEIVANISPCVTGKIAQLLSLPYSPDYRVGFPVFFVLAHRALAAAQSEALPVNRVNGETRRVTEKQRRG